MKIPQNGERTNDVIKKMIKNQKIYSYRYSKYYQQLYEETNLKMYERKSINLKSCLTVQLWDKYTLNLILDNLAHFNCKNRFCLNCQIMTNAKYVYEIKPVIDGLIAEGLKPYMLTLTVPNCAFEDLDKTIKKMNKCYNELFKKFNAEDKRKWKPRLAKIYGSLRVLEVTVNHDTKTFHPHFHILLLLDDPKFDPELDLNLKNYIEGRYSYKLSDFNKFSNFSIQIMKIWTMLWNGERITKNSYAALTSNPKEKEVLEINLTPFDGDYRELLKYTAKFDEVYEYEVFKYLELALRGKRRVATSGVLVGLIKEIIDEQDDLNNGTEQELILEIMEEPEKIKTMNLEELINDEKKEYRKLYRKTCNYDKEFYTKAINDLSK